MKPWCLYAVISMLFAGFTSVIAKLGLAGISGELGLAVRTCFVFIFVLAFTSTAVSGGEVSALARGNLLWLGLSGVTTAASWIFYYKAIKQGEVSTVALIDKGSVVVAHSALLPGFKRRDYHADDRWGCADALWVDHHRPEVGSRAVSFALSHG